MTVTVAPALYGSRAHIAAELASLDRALWLLLQLFHQHDAESGGQGWFLPRKQVESFLGPEPEPSPEIAAARQNLRAERERIQTGTEAGDGLRLADLARRLGLSPIEELAVLMCLALELDGKYAKIYAYLQDDLTRKLPTLDLVNKVAAEFGIAAGGAFPWCSTLPLFRHQLVHFAGDSDGTPRLGRGLSLNEVVRAWLTEEPRASMPGSAHSPAVDPRLVALIRASHERVVVQLHGPSAADCEALAASICRELGIGLCRDDALSALLNGESLLLSSPDSLPETSPQVTFAVSEQPWFPKTMPVGVTFLSVRVSIPEYAERRRHWERLLPDELDPQEIASIASRYRFSYSEMDQALHLARRHAQLRGAPLGPDDLKTACRARAQASFGGLARLTTPRQSWKTLVLPENSLRQLREICAHVRQRARVLHEWGFDARLSMGKGLYTLFLGPSGTGKTLAAEVIANELGLDLLKVDLSSVVSKYIGETEKNLQRVFEGAERTDAILFFDEADALFGKRTEVKDAHDRYANIEINFLLQRLEEFEGTAILATNFAQNIDDAFNRRIHLSVEFPFPTEPSRLAIWRNHFPDSTPVAADLDLPLMARQFQISGGNIRNIVLNAAFLAADDGDSVGMEHLMRAARREYEKLGKPYREQELSA